MDTKLNKESIATIELMIQDNIISQETAEKYFPELKEYHDEEIRKDLIKLVEESTKLRDYYDLRKMKNYLEKIGKQKYLQDKPKFKIGDWIVREKSKTYDRYVALITGLNDCYYYSLIGTNGNFSSPTSYFVDKEYHLWNIKDIKPGDVIINNGNVVLVKGIEKGKYEYIKSYCFMLRSASQDFYEGGVYNLNDHFKPATKEQQDIFFKRMKEAGYEWDDITLTLKKIDPIQQELIRLIKQWDDDGRAPYAGYLTKLSKKEILNWLENKTDNSSKSIQWNNYDDYMLGICIDAASGYFNPEDKEPMKNWLRSIKDKFVPSNNISSIQWKGDNLQEVIRFTGVSPYFNNWFKNWKEYEDYVHSHNNILKLFNADGSHYEVPVGSWIVHTPDGYNVASKAKFIPKFSDDELSIAKKDAYNDALDKIEYTSESPTFDDGWSAAINYIKKKFIK